MLARDNYFHQHAAQRGRNQPPISEDQEYEYQQDDNGNKGIYQQQNGYIDEDHQINEQSQEDDGEWQQQENEIGSNSDLPYEQKMLNKQLNDVVQSMRQEDDIIPVLESMTQLVLKAKEFLEEEKYNYMFETIIKVLNKDAVEALNENNWQKCSQILNVCDNLTQPHKYGFFVEMRSLSLNNQGCMYKRMQEYQMALSCFEKALHLQIQQNSKVYFGYTHLNISAILSQTGEHQQALSHAKKAVIQLHKDYLECQKQGLTQQELKQQDSYIETCNNLALAFYNVAVEEEHFNNIEMATLNYENALTFSEDNLGKNHHTTIQFRETLNEFLYKLSDSQRSQRGNVNRVIMRPKGQLKNMFQPLNKQIRPMSAPRKEQQALEQIQYIEKKISTIKDAYNLKGSDFEFKGTQIRLRSTSRKTNNQSNNNQFIKICNPKKRQSPGSDKQHKMMQQSSGLANYEKYIDAHGTRGAITASIKFHRTQDQNGNKNFKISQRGQPITVNHNNSKGYLDNSSNTLQPLSESYEHHPLKYRNAEIVKQRPTSANQGNRRVIKRDRSNDSQNYQNNTSYTQGNISFENKYKNTSSNPHPYIYQSQDQPQSSGQRFPFQYPVLKRNNEFNDQQIINNGRLQSNISSSTSQGTNSQFQNNSNRRINNNIQYNNKDNKQDERNPDQNAFQQRLHQQQFQKQNYPYQNNNYVRQSPNKIKKGVNFSEEEEESYTKQYSNRQVKHVQRNNFLNSSGPNPQNNSDNSYNHGNNSTNISSSLNNLNNNTSINNNTNNSFRSTLPNPNQNVKYSSTSGQNSRKYYDDFQPDENDQNIQEEVYEVIHEEEEDENKHPRSASAAAQQIQNNVIDNYELDWEDDYNDDVVQNPQIKKNQNEFLNTLKQHQHQDKLAIDSDIERKKKEQEELQKRIEQLKQIEIQEQQKLNDQEKVKKQQLIEISEKEKQLNKRIQELIQAENEEKQKYAKLKEQEEKERQLRLLELENISKQAEEQKQKLEEIRGKDIESQNNLGKSQKIGSEEQFPFSASDRQNSSRRILIKKSSGFLLNSHQNQPDNELTEEFLNTQLKANSNYLILREFSEKDINLIDPEKNSIQSLTRMSSDLNSTRRGLLAAVFELNLQMLIIIYADNQFRLQQSQSNYPQVSSSSSLRRKNDQWQHSMDWSDCSVLLEQMSIDELKTLLLHLFENEIESHLIVNLKERCLTLNNQISLQIIQNLSPMLLKVSLKKNLRHSYVEIDNSASGLIENKTSTLLAHIDNKDIIEKYKEMTFLDNSGNEIQGVFAVYYYRKNKQLVFEFISLLHDENLTRKTYVHKIDLSQMSDHYQGGDYLNNSQFTKIVKEIFSEYQKVVKQVRLVDEKNQGNKNILKIPFLQKWNYNEVVQDTPKHTIEAKFLISQDTQIGLSTLVIEETLKEKEKKQLTDEDFDNLIIISKQNLLQIVEERDIIQNYQKFQVISNKSKNQKSKDGILGLNYNRKNNSLIIEFIAVRKFDIEDTCTYQHIVDIRLICEHYGQNRQYLTCDQVTNVVTQIIGQYKLVQSKITIEPNYLNVPFDQDWMYDEVIESEQNKIYTFFNFSTRPKGKTIIEKKQTIQNLIPQPKKTKKSDAKYSKEQEISALKIQSHYKTQSKYKNTKTNIQKAKKFIFAKTIDIKNIPYFITLFQNLENRQYYSSIQSLQSRKNQQKYINFTQQIYQSIQEIIDNPDSFFDYYNLDINAQQFKYYDKKNESAKKITTFFQRIKKQNSLKKEESKSIIQTKENISPVKQRQSSAQMTQNEIYEDFSSISRAYKSNQRQTDDRDLEISPSIEKQSFNEVYFERQKIHLESSGIKSAQDKNSHSQTLISSGLKQDSIQDNSNKNLKAEFIQQELNDSLNKKSSYSNKQISQKERNNKKETDSDHLAFDNNFEKIQKDEISQKSQKIKQNSTEKYDNYEFDQFEDSIQEQNKINKENQNNESSEDVRLSQQSIRSGKNKNSDRIQKQDQFNEFNGDKANKNIPNLHSSESNTSIKNKDVSIIQQNKRQSEAKNQEEFLKQEQLNQLSKQSSSKHTFQQKPVDTPQSSKQGESNQYSKKQDESYLDEQKQENFDEIKQESSSKNTSNLHPKEYSQSKIKQEDEFNLKLGQNLAEDISPIPKKLGTTEFYQQQNNDVSPQFSIYGMSVNEDEIFDESLANQYVSPHQSKQIKVQSFQLELDMIDIYNVSKKAQRISLQTVTLKSYFDLETNKIVLSCQDIPSIQEVQFPININKLKCYDTLAQKTPKNLKNINHEEITNEVQEYIYSTLLIYVVDSTEIVVLSESQLNLIKRIQNKFILNHYRYKFQVKIDDELQNQYSCFVQIGYIKNTIFILIITQNIQNQGEENEYVKKFVKLHNISIRQISRNQQKYLHDNIQFNKTDKYFQFDINQFERIVQLQYQQQRIKEKIDSSNQTIENIKNIQLNQSVEQNKLNKSFESNKSFQNNSFQQNRSVQQNKSIEQRKSIEQSQDISIQQDKLIEQNKSIIQNQSIDSIQSEQNKISENSQIHQNNILDNIQKQQVENLEDSSILYNTQQSKKSNINTPINKDNNILEQYENQFDDIINLIKNFPVQCNGKNQKQIQISAYWMKNDNTISLKSDQDDYIIQYNYTLKQTMGQEQLKQLSQQILSKCYIYQNKIVYYGQKEEESATKLNQVLTKEVTIKSIDIHITNQNIQGSAYFGRKGAIWFMKLYTNMKITNKNDFVINSNVNNNEVFIQTDYIEIKQMSKLKRQKIIKYFDFIINSNIEIESEQLKFIKKQQFLDEIQFQIITSPRQQRQLD